MGHLTKQIQWLGYHRLLGSVFNHKEGSDCEHDLNLGPGADVRPPVIGDDVGHGRGGPSAPTGTVRCEVGRQSRAGGEKIKFIEFENSKYSKTKKIRMVETDK